MKKITRVMIIAVGLAASAAASAAGTGFTSGHKVTSGTAGECPMLSEDVTLNLSKNVGGAFYCNQATTDIRVATCHSAGSNKATNIDCALVGFAADGTTPIFNGAGCTGKSGESYAIAGYRMFVGSSRGGSTAPMDNGATACIDSTVPAAFSYLQ